MIPIYSDVIEIIDLENFKNDIESQNYKNLLLKEISFCLDNSEKLLNKAKKTYKIYKENKPYMKKIVDSCCDFDLLLKKMREYIKNT